MLFANVVLNGAAMGAVRLTTSGFGAMLGISLPSASAGPLTLAMFLRSLLFGGVMGLTLFLLSAPLWVFYVAPISIGPWIVWELLRLGGTEGRSKEKEAPEEIRSRATPEAWHRLAPWGRRR
jgi:hypothetical protein